MFWWRIPSGLFRSDYVRGIKDHNTVTFSKVVVVGLLVFSSKTRSFSRNGKGDGKKLRFYGRDIVDDTG